MKYPTVEEMQGQITSLQSSLAASERKAFQLVIDGMTEKANDALGKWSDTENRLHAEHEARVKAEERIKELWQTVTDLEEDALRFPTLAEFSNLQDDYEKIQQQNATLAKQVEEMETNLSEARADEDSLWKERDKLKHQLEEAQERLKYIAERGEQALREANNALSKR